MRNGDKADDGCFNCPAPVPSVSFAGAVLASTSAMSDRPKQHLTARTSESSLLRRFSSRRNTLQVSGEGDHYNNGRVRGDGVDSSLRRCARPRALSLDDAFDGADEHYRLRQTSPEISSPPSPPLATRITMSKASGRRRSNRSPLANMNHRKESADSPSPTSSSRVSSSSSTLEDNAIHVAVDCCESVELDPEVEELFAMQDHTSTTGDQTSGRRNAPLALKAGVPQKNTEPCRFFRSRGEITQEHYPDPSEPPAPVSRGTTYTASLDQVIGETNQGEVTEEEHSDDALLSCVAEPPVNYRKELPDSRLSFDRGQPVPGGYHLELGHDGTPKGSLETTAAVHAALPRTESDLGVEQDETDGINPIVATSLSQAVAPSKLPKHCSPHGLLSSRLAATRVSSITSEARALLGGSTTGLAGGGHGVVVTEAWAEPGEVEKMETTTSVIATCTGNDAAAESPRCSPHDHNTVILHEGDAAFGDAVVVEMDEHCLGNEAIEFTAAGVELARPEADKQNALAAEDNSRGRPRGIEDQAAPRQLPFTASSSPTTSPQRRNSEPSLVLQCNESVYKKFEMEEGRNGVGGRGIHPGERTVSGGNYESLCVPDNRQTMMNASRSEMQGEASRSRVSMRIARRKNGELEQPYVHEDLPVACVTTARGDGVKHPGSAVRREPRDVVHRTTTYESTAASISDNSGDDTSGSSNGPSITPGIAWSTCNSPSNFDTEDDAGASSSESLEEPNAPATSALNTIYCRNDGRRFISPVDDDDDDDDRVQYCEHYRTMGFLARQELEQFVIDRKRDDRRRAEERQRRDLASSGRWVNRTSRIILARGGRVSAPQDGDINNGDRQSVFERLASRTRAEETIPTAETGAPGYGYSHEDYILRSQLDGSTRQPFQPTISRRSNFLASRMTDRNYEGQLCERLYREGKGKLRKWQRRVERTGQALRDEAAATYVRPVSERILARRFRSTMVKALSVVDAQKRGWLSLSGLEYVLRECGMLHSENQRGHPDDVLLAVWGALSEEIGPSRTYSREDANLSGAACGVSVDRLSVVLTAVASGRRARDTSESEPADPGQHPARKNVLSPPVSASVSRGWPGGERGWGQAQPRAPVADGELADNRRTGDVADLCKDLRGIFETNRRFRGAGKSKRWSERRARGPSKCNAMSRLEAEGLADTRVDTPSGNIPGATPAQVAAMALRFEDKARARERKIELLRQAENARENALHTFEPCMVATPEGLHLRRKAAALAGQQVTLFEGERYPKTAVPCRDHAECCQQVEADLRQQPRTVWTHRTSEEREVVEKCTFRPHLFKQMASVSSPRHPFEDAAGGGVTTTRKTGRHRTTCTSFWNAQVERLKTGRAKRLRRLETENSTAPRSDPLPPSIQELLIDAGMQPQDHSRITKQDAQEGDSKSSRSPATPPRLCLERRMRARHEWEQEHSQEQMRKQVEEGNQREKRKRALVRASRRATANVGLEAALATRETETGRWDPPMLIAEIEFIPQARWVLLPLWMNTCVSRAAGNLNMQEQMPDDVATELEFILRNEMERARSRLGSDQAGDRKTGRKLVRGNRQTIPTVLLRVDTAGGPRLRG